jgi:RES domain-containing protein
VSSPLIPRRLDRTLVCYRIGDPNSEFPIYSSAGAARYPGRWHIIETPVIYASEHYSTAMLEMLSNSNELPPNQDFITITVPRETSFEVVTKDTLPGWDALDPTVSRNFGAEWVRAARSAILLVPSYVARIERNVIINPAHPDATAIETSLPEPVWWDERLFRKGPRAGWAEASKKLAEVGDGGIVWPEFGNDADQDLRW